jgi:hypothetical protein
MTMKLPKLSWTKLTPLGDAPIARSSHGVSLVGSNNQLFILGGEHLARTPIDDGCLWVVHDIHSATTCQWQQMRVENGPPARIAHAQAVCQEKLYIFGGRAGVAMNEQAMNDLWVLDTFTKKWSQLETHGSPPEARSFHRMVCVDQALYVFGGCGASGRLADLHRFNLETSTWETLDASKLRGRGGPNVLKLDGGTKLGVVAGFAGEETNDGHVYTVASNTWSETLMTTLEGMRPRSVGISGSFPSVGFSVIFGGEVDPSERGHEGAGGFANDIVLLNEKTGAYVDTVTKNGDELWPEERGWSDGAAIDNGDGSGSLYFFGGLAGDDASPKRLNDIWRLDIQAA